MLGEQGAWTDVEGESRYGEHPLGARQATIDKQLEMNMPQPAPFFKQAPCRGNADLFLPDDDGYHAPHLIEAAQAICAGCPVIVECEEWLMDQGSLLYTQGVWFGTDVAEMYKSERRAAARRRRGTKKPQPATT